VSEPRRHHLVPKSYLRRFADESDQIAVVRRDGSKRFVTSVEKAAAGTDFYAVETTDGRSQDVERMFSRIEGAAHEAIERVLSGAFPPTPDDRERIAWFVAVQFVRGRDMRQAHTAMIEYFTKLHVVNVSEAQVRAMLAKTGKTPTDEEVADLVGFASDPSAYSIEPSQNWLVSLMLRQPPKLMPMVAARQWQLARFFAPVLLTSDSPVILWCRTPPPAPYGVGFGTADEIGFPLDRHHLLVASRHDVPEVVVECDGATGTALNFLTAVRAYEWVYHHPAEDPLQGLELPPPEGRVKIVGPPLERMRRPRL
jgi:hypothetical protein